MSSAPGTLVEMRGITKRFGQVMANQAIDLDLVPGEIHGLLGENGSGKTTLMSILYGLHRPDEGEIVLDGRPTTFRSPADALGHGIAMIPQGFRLVPTLTVAENVALGLESRGRRHGELLREVRRHLVDLGERYGLEIDPDATVGALSMGERQRAEILRALYHESRILLMDEPTSVLTPGEVDRLFGTVARLTLEERRTVVLVTHKIREALAQAQRVTVLRQGQRVGTFTAASLTAGQLIEAMMGTQPCEPQDAGWLGPPRPRRANAQPCEPPALMVRDLCVRPEASQPLAARELRNVSFTVAAREIYGIAGVEGNGQAELEFALAGLLAPSSGEVRIAGSDAVAYIPSDGAKWGAIRDLTVAENLLLRLTGTTALLRPAPARRPDALAAADEVIARFNIVPPEGSRPARQLSGGNLQKMVLARELSRNPRVIVAAQPTMGLDVGAAAFVRDELRTAAGRGAGVVVISSDLDELLELCDRIGVLYHGELQGEWTAAAASTATLGAAMAGLKA
jgi:general nucleoside transport system ATP-binding protein